VIYIIIGQSGAGKTTYVKERWLKEPFEAKEDIVSYVVSGNVALIGKYGIGIRTEGTDTLSYNSAGKILSQIKRLYPSYDIVIEGDRINSERVFKSLSKLDCKLYLVTTSLKNSMERLRAGGSSITPSFVKATKTKSANRFLKYADTMNGEIIKT